MPNCITNSKCPFSDIRILVNYSKVQVGNDQEMAQSERKSHSKNKVGKN